MVYYEDWKKEGLADQNARGDNTSQFEQSV